jgi:dTDP-4-dehydrorhamnose 3,5-epimerase
MDIQDCTIEGLKIIRLNMRSDNRGFFVERFHARQFQEAGLPSDFVQDNHSRSGANVLRGLHYQHAPAQGKLVGVTRGRVWDVAVDIRPNSPTFGQHQGVELSGDNGLLFWMPAGFAHGFCVLGDEPADMIYKVNNYYSQAGEGGIRYDDPKLNISWPLKHPIISDRDRQLPGWQAYCANPPQWRHAA